MKNITRSLLVGLCLIVPTVASASWYVDWRGLATLSKATWTLTGSNSASRTVAPLFNTYTYIGASPLSNLSSVQATVQVQMNDNTTTGCSAVRVELHGTIICVGNPSACDGASCATSTPQVTSPFRSQSWSSCINGSNGDFWTSTTFGIPSITLTEGDGGNMGSPAAGDNYYLYTTYIYDDFGSRSSNSCYKTYDQ